MEEEEKEEEREKERNLYICALIRWGGTSSDVIDKLVRQKTRKSNDFW